MSVQDKIAKKQAEMQEREQNGRFKKKYDPFLLWGEYPHGWQMIKDLILCLMLMNALIGLLKQVDLASLMTPNTIAIVNQARIQPAKASETTEEVKAPKNAKMTAIVTAYNSEESQTDADPFTMASGKKVYDGAIANNCLAFGTKVKLNGKTYTVEDRMNKRYGCEHFDVWMEEYDEAIAWGKKTLEYEIQ